MKPFAQYPDDGISILPVRTVTNCRHGYGLTLQKLTGQSECAYCGVDLTADYYRWLLLSVDHVIPVKECARLGIIDDWSESYSNMVICCLGCNGLNNRYRVNGYEHKSTWTLKEFFQLRNVVFEERESIIKKSRLNEIAFFNCHPWKPL
jgi:hypothetical protein